MALRTFDSGSCRAAPLVLDVLQQIARHDNVGGKLCKGRDAYAVFAARIP